MAPMLSNYSQKPTGACTRTNTVQEQLSKAPRDRIWDGWAILYMAVHRCVLPPTPRPLHRFGKDTATELSSGSWDSYRNAWLPIATSPHFSQVLGCKDVAQALVPAASALMPTLRFRHRVTAANRC